MPFPPPPPPSVPPSQYGGSTDQFMMMNYSNPLLSQQTEYGVVDPLQEVEDKVFLLLILKGDQC